jgi:hypothetical protein
MDFTKCELDKHAFRQERKYYGCIHCKSMHLVRLPYSAGDPEGIRRDSGCLVCGGVFGSSKSSAISIDRTEFQDVYDEGKPIPDQEKVLAMKILIAMEQKLGADFRDWEVEYAETIYKIVLEHNEKLNARVKLAEDRVAKAKEFLEV